MGPNQTDKLLHNKRNQKENKKTAYRMGVKDAITEMKNVLEGIKSRICEAEQINEVKDRLMEITVMEQREKNEKK